MRDDRFEVSVTFDLEPGYIAGAPELRQPIVALSLASLRNRMLSGNGSAPWASLSQITAKNGGDEQTFGAK